jgi:hypothetical protein
MGPLHRPPWQCLHIPDTRQQPRRTFTSRVPQGADRPAIPDEGRGLHAALRRYATGIRRLAATSLRDRSHEVLGHRPHIRKGPTRRQSCPGALPPIHFPPGIEPAQGHSPAPSRERPEAYPGRFSEASPRAYPIHNHAGTPRHPNQTPTTPRKTVTWDIHQGQGGESDRTPELFHPADNQAAGLTPHPAPIATRSS